MKYSIAWTVSAKRELNKLDGSVQRRIVSWLSKNIENTTDPRAHGKALSENLAGLWRYRIGDYRVICSIEDDKLMVVAVSVGHRSYVY